MRKYSDEQERTIRAGRLAREWAHSGLLDAAQHARVAPELEVDLRRTNLFLRLTLFGFGLLIIAAATGLVMVLVDVKNAPAAGSICLLGAVACVALAEFLVGSLRLYRFGIEEACAAGGAILAAVGCGLAAEPFASGSYERQIMVALAAGAAAGFVMFRRFGYVYAAVAAMACAALVPFELGRSPAAHRLLAMVILGTCAAIARAKYRANGDDFPGAEYGALQAAAIVGVYATLNMRLMEGTGPLTGSFYWFTYAMIWIIPVVAFVSAIRDRDRLLLDVSLGLALATLVTNKPYLGLERKPWDPILLGVLMIGAALALRRWIDSGPKNMRRGITATRILRSEKDRLAAVGVASGFIDAPGARHDSAPAPDPFAGSGGRAGGGGASSSF
jgi:uncharacterized membrane protein YgcG